MVGGRKEDEGLVWKATLTSRPSMWPVQTLLVWQRSLVLEVDVQGPSDEALETGDGSIPGSVMAVGTAAHLPVI